MVDLKKEIRDPFEGLDAPRGIDFVETTLPLPQDTEERAARWDAEIVQEAVDFSAWLTSGAGAAPGTPLPRPIRVAALMKMTPELRAEAYRRLASPSAMTWRPRPNFARPNTFSPRVFARLMTPYFAAALAREQGRAVAAPADENAWCWRERHGAS